MAASKSAYVEDFYDSTLVLISEHFYSSSAAFLFSISAFAFSLPTTSATWFASFLIYSASYCFSLT